MVNASEILNANCLIVDDQEFNVQLLEQLLRRAGYTHVSSTRDPQAVCALHRDHDYDLILLDLKMPGMDGFAVMEGLKAIETDGYIPVLVITAQPGHRQRALRAGAKDFVSAPYDHAEVLTRVHNLLEVRLLYKRIEHDKRVLESLALHDPLTGLPNRRLLADRLSMAMEHARGDETFMAVVYLALDGFTQLNDLRGHDAGELLLKLVANRLVGAVRQEVTVARLGGDEFMLVLWDVGAPSDAATVAGKVMEALAQPFDIGDNTVNITASAEVGVYPVPGEDAVRY